MERDRERDRERESDAFSLYSKVNQFSPWPRQFIWLERCPITGVAGSISSQGPYLGCRFNPLWSGWVKETTNPCFSLESTFLSLCSSFPSFVSRSKKKNNVLWRTLKKKKVNQFSLGMERILLPWKQAKVFEGKKKSSPGFITFRM